MDKATERIKADAEAATRELNKKQMCGPIELMGYRNGYIAGATAENNRAQKMADALEWIKTYGPVDELTVKFIDKTLSEWRGAGKEVKPEPEPEGCPYCGSLTCTSDHK